MQGRGRYRGVARHVFVVIECFRFIQMEMGMRNYYMKFRVAGVSGAVLETVSANDTTSAKKIDRGKICWQENNFSFASI